MNKDQSDTLAAAQRRKANEEAESQLPGLGDPQNQTVCVRCKRPTEYQGRFCYSCETALFGEGE